MSHGTDSFAFPRQDAILPVGNVLLCTITFIQVAGEADGELRSLGLEMSLGRAVIRVELK